MTPERASRERGFWDAFAGGYDLFMRIARPTYGEITDCIYPWLNESSNVLEVAAGTGLIALEVAGKVKRVSGIDISPSMIGVAARKAAARGITNAEFSVQDAYRLPFESGAFDVVVATNVLHVLMQPERVLSEVHRVLKDDGILVAPTYCHGENRRSRTVSFIMGLSGFKTFHKWSIRSYTAFFEDCDFGVVEAVRLENRIPVALVVAAKRQRSSGNGPMRKGVSINV